MSFYDDASLIMFPSGYKEDKIYSLKPTDGSGDLTFTRASTATRVNSDGLIETSPVNLATNSENFSSWTLAAVTVTANDITAPNGTLTADKLTISSNGNDVKQTISVMPNSVYTWTFYVYGGTATGQQMRFYDNTNSTNIEYYIYSSSVVLGAWVKIERTFTTPSGCYEIQAWVLAATSTIGTMWVWGAQLNIGSTAKPYFPTTDRLDVPRIDYTGGGCGKLLLESQRTNLLTYSEQLDNAAWLQQGGATITANQTTSPDGTTNADKLNVDIQAYSYTYQVISATTAIYTESIYAKKGTKNWLFILNTTGEGARGWFNLNTGVVGTVASGYTGTITDVGNGWYRCTLTNTTSEYGNYVGFGFVDADNTVTPTSTGYGYLWGGQLEAGSYPTSYIPTLASSVTRLADAASKTGISSLIGQTEGVLFYDFVWGGAISAAGDYPIVLSGSDFNNFVGLNTAFNQNQLLAYSGGSIVAAIAGGDFVVGQRYKIALAYKANDFVYYVNGTLQGSDTSGAAPIGLANFQMVTPFGSKTTMQNVNSILFFTTRLTNTQLATLTTL